MRKLDLQIFPAKSLRSCSTKSGQDLVEYGLTMAVVALGSIAGMSHRVAQSHESRPSCCRRQRCLTSCDHLAGSQRTSLVGRGRPKSQDSGPATSSESTASLSSFSARPPTITESPTEALPKGIVDVFGIDDLPPGFASRRLRQRELNSLVGCIDQQQKAVVDNRLPILIGHLQCAAVEHQGDGAAPLRVPCLVRHFVAVRIEPRRILLHQHDGSVRAPANFAILKEFAAVQIGMREAELE